MRRPLAPLYRCHWTTPFASMKDSMGRMLVGSVAALALLACVSVAGAAGEIAARSAAANGKVAFSDPFNLYAVNQDGSGRRRLARCMSRSCEIRAYAWSPGGKRLAFLRGNRGRTKPSNLSLFVVKADGRGMRRLAGCGEPKWRGCGDFVGSLLSWSPDGSRLVVTRRGSLYVVNVDRAGYRRLTNCDTSSCFDMHPVWAPDGSRIALARWEVRRRSQSIYSVKVDGTDLARLTNLPGYSGDPVWSPDGSRIAFDAWGEGQDDRIYTMTADGSDLTLLTSGARGSGPGRPSWSPNGAQIVFFNTPGSPGAFSAEVWLTKADGSERRRLYQSDCCIGTWARPIWSPDGRYIAFGVGLSTGGEENGIFVMKTDGTQRRQLTGAVEEIAWQRKA
jgi:Tol biopolymer transport system component